MNACTNCASPVPARRPSNSGTHWCQNPMCQAAKQRYYRGRKAVDAEKTTAELATRLVHDLLHVPRKRCDRCGLEDALPGWVHRSADPLVPCFGTGTPGKELIGALDVIHPERNPKVSA